MSLINQLVSAWGSRRTHPVGAHCLREPFSDSVLLLHVLAYCVSYKPLALFIFMSNPSDEMGLSGNEEDESDSDDDDGPGQYNPT